MADVVDKVIGISSALSGLVSVICYKLYKDRTATSKHVRNIHVWNPDLALYDHLNSVDDGCLAYAAVEGVVKEIGRSLQSKHGDEKGVIFKSSLVEHKSKRVNGFWSDMQKTLRDNIDYVPFAIVKPEVGDSKFRIEVLEPGQAAKVHSELETVYHHFEPHKSSLFQAGLDRIFGEITKGVQESEEMLLTGTAVLGVGKVFLERDQMKLGPPDDHSKTFILTKMRLSELIRQYESQSATFKAIAMVSALIGGGLLAFLIFRRLRHWLEKRRERLEFEEIRRTLREAERPRRSPAGDTTERELRDEETCVVCLSSPRQVVTLNCGHLSMCTDCAEALPFPKKCPVCRGNVERFIPVYHP